MPASKPVRCVVLGGGGHARVVIDALRASGTAQPVAVLDTDRARWGGKLLGVPVLGGDDRLAELLRQGVRHFVMGVGGVGDNGPRRRLFDWACRQGAVPLGVRHPSAVCSKQVRIGPGSVIFAGAIVNVGARLGANVIINTGAIIEHDCAIADHAHLATGARLAGEVRVEAGAHVGAGATVRQRLVIGEGAVVGVGAVVVKDVPPGAVVAGVPARALGAAVEEVAGARP